MGPCQAKEEVAVVQLAKPEEVIKNVAEIKLQCNRITQQTTDFIDDYIFG